MKYQVHLVRDVTGLADLAESWTRLLRGAEGSIFASFEWNATWWKYFGGGKQLYVLVATDPAGQVCGIAPLMLQQSNGLRKLKFIGDGLSDSGDFVLDPACAMPVAQAIFDYLQHHRDQWDLVDLDEVPPYSLLAGWLESATPLGLPLIQLPRTECPFIPLPADWETYVRSLQRKPRQHLESFTRRFVEESGAFFRLVTAPAEVPAAVARFYQLHLARWAAREDALNPDHLAPQFLLFLEEVCRRCAERGWLCLSELCVGESTIASWICFQVNGRWQGYMTGFDPAWSQKRPGKILHGFVMRQALAEQARELDLGRGAEGYKYELGALNRQNGRVILANRTRRSALAFTLTGWRIQGRALVRRSREASAAQAQTS